MPFLNSIAASDFSRGVHEIWPLYFTHQFSFDLRRLGKLQNPVGNGTARLKNHVGNPKKNRGYSDELEKNINSHLQMRSILVCEERHSFALSTCASSTANPMNITLNSRRKVIVNDFSNSFEVHTTSHNFCSDHDPAFSFPHPT